MPLDKLEELVVVYHPEWWVYRNAVLPLTHRTEIDPIFPIVHKLGFILPQDPTTVYEGCIHLTAARVQKIEELAQRHYQSAVDMLQEWKIDD